MNIDYLMNDDWVFGKHTGKNMRWDWFHHRFLEGESIEPIELTTEILEKSGFRYTKVKRWMTEGDDWVWKIEDDYRQYCVEIEESGNDGGDYFIVKMANGVQYMEMYIRWVHELQQAMRLFGIKQEIKIYED